MNTNFTSLLPFLAALQRQPGTPQQSNPQAQNAGSPQRGPAAQNRAQNPSAGQNASATQNANAAQAPQQNARTPILLGQAPPPPKPPVDWAVNYNGHQVGDPRVREALGKISEQLYSRVNVTGGKRDAQTNQTVHGAPHSYHLTDQAADFHVQGMTDDQVDQALKDPNSPLATLGMNVIQHGPHTITSGAHVHIDSRNQPGTQTTFQHEGMTPEARNHYTADAQQAAVGAQNQARPPGPNQVQPAPAGQNQAQPPAPARRGQRPPRRP